ncbi:hypothetical protein PIN31115_02073 [Pandoraea iniqua]|uniref:Uncharacterized protein n=1 Tax=Pandoraea iniqua TaxID=2508288 RepID=A0A5E4UKH4_9BURK|nr:hypothetical protein [Pandoraea iniqua]VVE00392.1 hypothetical protein PIN31115_02073 [Pandoraea iniqua]
MKRLVALALTFFCALSFAGPDDVNFSQRNSTDTGNINRIPTHPATPGLLSYDSTALLPVWVTLGSGLTINSGVLALTATPVNADWNASSGLAQILNKPSIPAAQVNSDWAAASGVAQILNKPTIPAAQVNSDWNASTGVAAILNKPTIPAAFNFGAPNVRSLAVGTAFQATDTTKAAIVTVSPQCTAAITLSGGSTCTLQARVGATGVTCSTGTVVGTWTNGNTGTLTIGLALNQTVGGPGSINLPAGAFAILCATSGTFTVPNAVDQSAG